MRGDRKRAQEARYAAVVEAYKRNPSSRAVAKETGVSYQTVLRACHAAGLVVKRASAATVENEPAILEAFARTQSIKRTAREVGLTRDLVSSVLRANGLASSHPTALPYMAPEEMTYYRKLREAGSSRKEALSAVFAGRKK